jgi:pseudouridine-5'-phosphate glycosidase
MCLEEEEEQEIEQEEEEEEKEENKKVENKKFFVYLLESSKGATYVGATMDVARRLRQHNKEITGGAVATGPRVHRPSEKIFPEKKCLSRPAV